MSPTTTLRIVCTELEHRHSHITAVGTSSGSDTADDWWTVAQVRNAIRDGWRFYTYDPVTERTADVEPYDAYIGGRVIQTIRSSPDATVRNNLDNLRACRWKS
jgi:hypothetical protein